MQYLVHRVISIFYKGVFMRIVIFFLFFIMLNSLSMQVHAKDMLTLKCEAVGNYQKGSSSIIYYVRQTSIEVASRDSNRSYYEGVGVAYHKRSGVPGMIDRKKAFRYDVKIRYEPSKIYVIHTVWTSKKNWITLDRYSGEAILTAPVHGDEERLSGKCELIDASLLPEEIRQGRKF